MVGANPNQNQPPYQPWLTPDAVVVPGIQHDMPKHPEKFLPKFDPDRKDSAENHIKKFLLAIRHQGIRYEDVVCQLFPSLSKRKHLLGTSHLKNPLSLIGKPLKIYF
jgi:hypothetical protein